MTKIDFEQLAKGTRVLIGHEKGLATRSKLNLDELDRAPDEVVVVVPASLKSITPSYVQGLFAGSVRRLGETGFFRHYRFEAPGSVISDIRAGVDRILTDRHLSGIQ